jgi:hypothetical protein
MSANVSGAVNARHAAALDSFAERLKELDMFHAGMGKVHRTLEAIARDLEQCNIEYAIVGGMALYAHGYLRETVDVDILVTPEGLSSFAEQLVGKGYRPAFEGARKRFRHTETNVKVEFLTTGEYPGDGKPKPVAFPDPAEVSVVKGGHKVIALPALITMKLASGMTNPDRMKDLSDVQELIRNLRLKQEIADELHPYVRDKFLELFQVTRQDAEDVEND